jgi:hypothetical protein
MKVVYLVCFLVLANTALAIDTLALQKSMYKIDANFSVLIDKDYNYDVARKIIEKPDFRNSKIPAKIFRSYPSYWAAIYINNNFTYPIEIVAETYFAGSWLDNQPQVFCNYEPCPHPRKILVDEYSHMSYLKVEPGVHLLMAKISDYHLPSRFTPKISTTLDYEGNTYTKSIQTIFIFSFFIGAFAIIGMICFSLFLKLNDWALLWYAAYCGVIVISGYFSLQSRYQTFYWSFEYIPWYYTKMFVSMGLYITYVKFGKHFTDTGPEMTSFKNKCDRYVKVCLLFLIPEVILMTLGYEISSYNYHYFTRMLMAFYGAYLITYLWKFRKNVFTLFIIVGSCFLVVGELISNFVPRMYSAHVATGGAIIDSIIFTIGIAYRIHQHYQHERQLDEELFFKQNEIKELNIEKEYLNQFLLQSQMNPHFIFNALNSINRFIIKSEKDKASYYLSRFSKLIRAILDHSNLPEVTLTDEIKSIELYLELENLRFNNTITYSIDIDKNIKTDEIKIPPLIIQPFIENSILHGFNKINYAGELKITISIENSHLKIIIIDNGVGRLVSEKSKSIENNLHKSKGQSLTVGRIINYGKLKNNSSSVIYEDLYSPKGETNGTKVTILL